MRLGREKRMSYTTTIHHMCVHVFIRNYSINKDKGKDKSRKKGFCMRACHSPAPWVCIGIQPPPTRNTDVQLRGDTPLNSSD